MSDSSGSDKPSLVVLWWSFLKIGSVSFGGYMALVSMVQTDFAEKRKWISDDKIVESITLASLLPGPLAVNIATYIGHSLNRFNGAVISFLAVLTPSFILITVLTHLYFVNVEAESVSLFFKGVMPVVVAIVLKVGITMGVKNVKKVYQFVIVLASIIVSLLWKGFLSILIIMFLAGLVGYLVEIKNLHVLNIDDRTKRTTEYSFNKWVVVFLASLLAIFTLMPLIESYSLYGQLISTFGSMSLSLFGGGYVFIPLMEQIIVDQKGWLTNKEFIDAIAMGQITPGPILISAAFVGYKLKGVLGAVVATLSIFLPSALLMIIVGTAYDQIKENVHLKAVFKGLRTAIVGLILSAVISIIGGSEQIILVSTAGAICFGILWWTTINPILLILICGVLGIFAPLVI